MERKKKSKRRSRRERRRSIEEEPSTPQEEPVRCIEGWLSKKGTGFFGSWAKRFFLVKSSRLRYFKTDKPSNHDELANYSLVGSVVYYLRDDVVSRRNCFGLSVVIPSEEAGSKRRSMIHSKVVGSKSSGFFLSQKGARRMATESHPAPHPARMARGNSVIQSSHRRNSSYELRQDTIQFSMKPIVKQLRRRNFLLQARSFTDRNLWVFALISQGARDGGWRDEFSAINMKEYRTRRRSIREGFAEKCGPTGSRWKSRYIVLIWDSLHYFGAPTDRSPKGSVALTPQSRVDGDGTGRCFYVQSTRTSRKYYFRCTTSWQCEDWINDIREAIEYICYQLQVVTGTNDSLPSSGASATPSSTSLPPPPIGSDFDSGLSQSCSPLPPDCVPSPRKPPRGAVWSVGCSRNDVHVRGDGDSSVQVDAIEREEILGRLRQGSSGGSLLRLLAAPERLDCGLDDQHGRGEPDIGSECDSPPPPPPPEDGEGIDECTGDSQRHGVCDGQGWVPPPPVDDPHDALDGSSSATIDNQTHSPRKQGAPCNGRAVPNLQRGPSLSQIHRARRGLRTTSKHSEKSGASGALFPSSSGQLDGVGGSESHENLYGSASHSGFAPPLAQQGPPPANFPVVSGGLDDVPAPPPGFFLGDVPSPPAPIDHEAGHGLLEMCAPPGPPLQDEAVEPSCDRVFGTEGRGHPRRSLQPNPQLAVHTHAGPGRALADASAVAGTGGRGYGKPDGLVEVSSPFSAEGSWTLPPGEGTAAAPTPTPLPASRMGTDPPHRRHSGENERGVKKQHHRRKSRSVDLNVVGPQVIPVPKLDLRKALQQPPCSPVGSRVRAAKSLRIGAAFGVDKPSGKLSEPVTALSSPEYLSTDEEYDSESSEAQVLRDDDLECRSPLEKSVALSLTLQGNDEWYTSVMGDSMVGSPSKCGLQGAFVPPTEFPVGGGGGSGMGAIRSPGYQRSARIPTAFDTWTYRRAAVQAAAAGPRPVQVRLPISSDQPTSAHFRNLIASPVPQRTKQRRRVRSGSVDVASSTLPSIVRMPGGGGGGGGGTTTGGVPGDGSGVAMRERGGGDASTDLNAGAATLSSSDRKSGVGGGGSGGGSGGASGCLPCTGDFHYDRPLPAIPAVDHSERSSQGEDHSDSGIHRDDGGQHGSASPSSFVSPHSPSSSLESHRPAGDDSNVHEPSSRTPPRAPVLEPVPVRGARLSVVRSPSTLRLDRSSRLPRFPGPDSACEGTDGDWTPIGLDECAVSQAVTGQFEGAMVVQGGDGTARDEDGGGGMSQVRRPATQVSGDYFISSRSCSRRLEHSGSRSSSARCASISRRSRRTSISRRSSRTSRSCSARSTRHSRTASVQGTRVGQQPASPQRSEVAPREVHPPASGAAAVRDNTSLSSRQRSRGGSDSQDSKAGTCIRQTTQTRRHSSSTGSPGCVVRRDSHHSRTSTSLHRRGSGGVSRSSSSRSAERRSSDPRQHRRYSSSSLFSGFSHQARSSSRSQCSQHGSLSQRSSLTQGSRSSHQSHTNSTDTVVPVCSGDRLPPSVPVLRRQSVDVGSRVAKKDQGLPVSGDSVGGLRESRGVRRRGSYPVTVRKVVVGRDSCGREIVNFERVVNPSIQARPPSGSLEDRNTRDSHDSGRRGNDGGVEVVADGRFDGIASGGPGSGRTASAAGTAGDSADGTPADPALTTLASPRKRRRKPLTGYPQNETAAREPIHPAARALIHSPVFEQLVQSGQMHVVEGGKKQWGRRRPMAPVAAAYADQCPAAGGGGGGGNSDGGGGSGNSDSGRDGGGYVAGHSPRPMADGGASALAVKGLASPREVPLAPPAPHSSVPPAPSSACASGSVLGQEILARIDKCSRTSPHTSTGKLSCDRPTDASRSVTAEAPERQQREAPRPPLSPVPPNTAPPMLACVSGGERGGVCKGVGGSLRAALRQSRSQLRSGQPQPQSGRSDSVSSAMSHGSSSTDRSRPDQDIPSPPSSAPVLPFSAAALRQQIFRLKAASPPSQDHSDTVSGTNEPTRRVVFTGNSGNSASDGTGVVAKGGPVGSVGGSVRQGAVTEKPRRMSAFAMDLRTAQARLRPVIAPASESSDVGAQSRPCDVGMDNAMMGSESEMGSWKSLASAHSLRPTGSYICERKGSATGRNGTVCPAGGVTSTRPGSRLVHPVARIVRCSAGRFVPSRAFDARKWSGERRGSVVKAETSRAQERCGSPADLQCPGVYSSTHNKQCPRSSASTDSHFASSSSSSAPQDSLGADLDDGTVCDGSPHPQLARHTARAGGIVGAGMDGCASQHAPAGEGGGLAGSEKGTMPTRPHPLSSKRPSIPSSNHPARFFHSQRPGEPLQPAARQDPGIAVNVTTAGGCTGGTSTHLRCSGGTLVPPERRSQQAQGVCSAPAPLCGPPASQPSALAAVPSRGSRAVTVTGDERSGVVGERVLDERRTCSPRVPQGLPERVLHRSSVPQLAGSGREDGRSGLGSGRARHNTDTWDPRRSHVSEGGTVDSVGVRSSSGASCGVRGVSRARRVSQEGDAAANEKDGTAMECTSAVGTSAKETSAMEVTVREGGTTGSGRALTSFQLARLRIMQQMQQAQGSDR